MSNRLKSTNDGLQAFKRFQKAYQPIFALMDDIAQIDSLEKAASEAEAARDKAIGDKERIDTTASSIIKEAQEQADKIKANAESNAESTLKQARIDASLELEKSHKRYNEIVADGDKKVAELVDNARKEAANLEKFIKDASLRAKSLDAKVKSLDNTIATKTTSLETIEKKLADLQSHFSKN